MGEEIGGTFIRHAFFAPRPGSPTTIVALAIAVVLSPFRTLLVATVGDAMLLAKAFPPTQRTAVALSSITVAADPEDPAACVGAAKSLMENRFGTNRHLRPEAGLDNGQSSWQVRAIAQDGYLMKVASGDSSRCKRPESPILPDLKPGKYTQTRTVERSVARLRETQMMLMDDADEGCMAALGVNRRLRSAPLRRAALRSGGDALTMSDD